MSEDQNTESTKMQVTLARIETTLISFVAEQRLSNVDLSTRMADHENRIRGIEKDNEQLRGSRAAMRWLIAALGALGVVGPLLSWFINNK